MLSTSIHGYQEKEKKTQNLEITISRITAWGEKEKNFFSSHQLKKKKIKRYAVSWSKEQKPTVKYCNATITNSAQYKVELITEIKSRVGTIQLQFRLNSRFNIYIYIVNTLLVT